MHCYLFGQYWEVLLSVWFLRTKCYIFIKRNKELKKVGNLESSTSKQTEVRKHKQVRKEIRNQVKDN